MSNYETMTGRIAREIHRSDLTTEIEEAVLTAITQYEGERFWFNETHTSLTASQTQYYALPADIIEIDSITIDINGEDYPLIPRTYQYLEDLAVSSDTYQGYPRDYAIYEDQLRIYPAASSAYVMRISYHARLQSLSASTDSNGWMTHAEKLIRSEAKSDLYRHVIHDERKADSMKTAALEALDKLLRRSQGKLSTGYLRPTEF